MNDKVKAIINNSPKSPGVYMFKNAEGRVIYVGKAKGLKNRLKSYLQYKNSDDVKLRALGEKIAGLEVIRTENELEALILESNLVKKHKPRYNVLLKDDKAYPYIKIDMKKDWPRPEIVRRFYDDKATYFGPYTSTRALNNIVSVLNKAFPFRKCKDAVFSSAKRPCLNHEIGLCMAPCQGMIEKKDYLGIMRGVIAILKGHISDVISELEREMTLASDNLEFEEASKIRERLKSLYMLSRGQSVVMPNDSRNIDIISIGSYDGKYMFNILYVRSGMLLGQANVSVLGEGDKDDALKRFLVDHYIKNMLPDLISVPFEIKDKTVLELLKTKVSTRASKEIKRMREIGKDNLEGYMNNLSSKHGRWEKAAKEFKRVLKLSTEPETIECYDMSNISGQHAVGVRVVFNKGIAAKSEYRKYKIRGDFRGDDLKMMKEVVSRRISHLEKEPLPDIMLIDGGRTQLGAVKEVLDASKCRIQALISIAKDKDLPKGLSKDKLYIERKGGFHKLDITDDTLNFMKMVRDEAHRFAISYYRDVHSKEMIKE